MHPILVLGIGNILQRDDGIGVRVIEAMRYLELPPEVELADGGAGGAKLVNLIAGRRKVIVIDAVDAEAEPGTVVRLTPAEIAAEGPVSLSLHEVGLMDALEMAAQLRSAPGEVVIIGVQPAAVDLGVELSDELAAALPHIIDAVRAEL